MSSARKKKKKRVRVGSRPPERHLFGNDEARFRLASQLSLGLALALLMTALTASYAVPAWNRALGPTGNMALRVAGIAMVIVALMFRHLGKGK
jgi:hypothetical protein